MDISKDISTDVSEETASEAAETPKKQKGEGFKKFLGKLVGGDDRNVGFRFVLLMFFALFAVNMAFSYYTKVISIYNDELFYMNIAQNIFNGNGAVVDVRGGGFNKILYSLLLAPTYFIKNALVRVNVISILNCLVMAASVFPVWLISKDIKLSKKSTILALVITVVFPEFALCSVFMSEVLYIPLVLWFIHFWFVSSQKPTIKNGVIMGVVGYLCYFTKEVFLAVPVACAAIETVYPLIAFLTRDDKSAKVRDFYSGRKFLNLAVFLASFGVLAFAVQFIFFNGEGDNVYNAGSVLEGFFTGYNIFQAIYEVIYYIAAVMVAVLIVPVVYPLLRYKTLDDSVRKLYCFCVTAMLATFAVTVLSVGRAEMTGSTTLRVLTRYFSSFVLLLLVLFLKSIEKDREEREEKLGRYWGVLLFAAVVPCLIFKGANVSIPDTMLLEVYRNFKSSVGSLAPTEEQIKEYFGSFAKLYPENEVMSYVPLYAILYSALLLLIVLGFHALFTHRRERQARQLIVMFIIIIMTANGISSRTSEKLSNNAYTLTVTEVLKLNDYLAEHNEPCNILYLLDGTSSDIKRSMDTYLDLNKGQRIYPMLSTSLDIDKMRANDFRSDKMENKYLYFSETPDPVFVESYDYIITDINTELKTNRLSGIEKVEELDTIYFTLYKNTDPSTVLMELDESKAFSGDDFVIHFSADENAVQIDDGLSFGSDYYNADIYCVIDSDMSETGCYDVRDLKFSVTVPVVGEYKSLKVKADLINTNTGFQPYVIAQDGAVIAKGAVYGEETVEFTADVENGYLSFVVVFPNTPIYSFYTYYFLADGFNMAWVKEITVSAE